MTLPANFVSRASWGSTFDYSANTRMPTSGVDGVALHWEGSPIGTFAHSECDNHVRAIEKYHVEVKGWAGIAYNAIVCPHGYIFEGRGTKYRSAANGDAGPNNNWFAVCYLGGKGDPFTTPAKSGYIAAVKWLRADGHAGSRVVGHRDLWSTECPGATIETWLKATDFSAGATAPAPAAPIWGQPATWVLGGVSSDVTRLGERLVIHAKALGLPAPYVSGPGPTFTEVDVAAVKAFQTAQGWAGADADGYPGTQTFALLAADPITPSAPAPVKSFVSREFFLNRADYDDVHGMESKDERDAGVARTCLEKDPLWIHLVECSASQIDDMDALFPDYHRMGAGGKGRESWYKKGQGVKIIAAELDNVDHMLDGDTKEFLKIVWEIDGIRCSTAVGHNENDGTGIQRYQLWDVVNAARDFGKAHDSVLENTIAFMDSNYPGASTALWNSGNWKNAGLHADVEVNTDRKTTNGWHATGYGPPIDIAAARRDAHILKAEVVLLGGEDVSDHNGLYIKRELVSA